MEMLEGGRRGRESGEKGTRKGGGEEGPSQQRLLLETGCWASPPAPFFPISPGQNMKTTAAGSQKLKTEKKGGAGGGGWKREKTEQKPTSYRERKRLINKLRILYMYNNI